MRGYFYRKALAGRKHGFLAVYLAHMTLDGAHNIVRGAQNQSKEAQNTNAVRAQLVYNQNKMIDTIPSEAFTKTEASERFLPIIKKMVEHSLYSQRIDERVYQPSNEQNQQSVLEIVRGIVRPESRIVNMEHLERVAALLKEGKSCLFLPEHFSNFDYPALFYLAQQNPAAQSIFKNLVCMAASKLNTESKVVLAFSEAFHRIMIYPARAKLQADGTADSAEQQTLDQLNQRALRTMGEFKKEGRAILMFPSGTRFRPGNNETRNALPQAASFMRQFDYFCFIGIAGNLLMVNPNNQMAQDIAREDALVYWIDEVRESKAFLAEVHEKTDKAHESADLPAFKQAVAQEITARLLALHEKAEAVRAPLVAANPPRYLGPFLP